MALNQNKQDFFHHLAGTTKLIFNNKIDKNNAIEKLQDIFQEYYNVYEAPLFAFVKDSIFQKFIAPLTFYFDDQSNIAGYYHFATNKNNVNAGTVFAEDILTDKLDPATKSYFNLFEVFATISHESKHNRQTFPFLASTLRSNNLNELKSLLTQIYPDLVRLKRKYDSSLRGMRISQNILLKNDSMSAYNYASDFTRNKFPQLKNKNDITEYLLDYISIQSMSSLSADEKHFIENLTESLEQFITSYNALTIEKNTFINALGENGDLISKAAIDFYEGNRIGTDKIKNILEESYNITPTLWEQELLNLTKEDLQDLSFAWYSDNLIEVDARATELNALKNLLSDLNEYIATTQSEQEKTILAPAVDVIQTQIEKQELLEQVSINDREKFIPTIDKVINPEKMLADLIATGREALKAEYTQEFLDKNNAFSGEFAGIKFAKESQLVRSILTIAEKYNEIYHMSTAQFHLLLIQHGFIESAETLARCNNDEKSERLSLDHDEYYNLLMKKPITLNSLCYIDKLSTEQISSVVEHFINQGQLIYVEKIIQLCKSNEANTINFLFKPEQIKRENTRKGTPNGIDDYIDFWAADSNLKDLSRCQDIYKALKKYTLKLADTPVEKLSFDEIDDALSSLQSVARILGFENYLTTNTPPPQEEQDAVNFFNIFNNLETILRIKLSNTQDASFDHTRIAYACPEDRKAFRSSPQQRREYRVRVYGELENERIDIKREAYTKFSHDKSYSEENDYE